jgi:hypothetical protein
MWEYLQELDEQDKLQNNDYVPHGKSKVDIEKTLSILAERKAKYEVFQNELKTLAENGCTTEELQISTVDPDARSMIFKHNNTAIGYNVQTAGDAKHKLIVHFEVTNVGDANALSALAIDTKQILGLGEDETYNALADAGYDTAEELAKCAENGIITYVCPREVAAAQSKMPQEKAQQNQNQTFTKDQFKYDATTDSYTCPNQQKLTSNGTWYIHKATSKRGKDRKYKQYTLPSATCKTCPFAAECQGKRAAQWHGKTIERKEHDEAVEANRKRIVETPSYYQHRKEIIEHPFGTIKRSWGYNYTLVRTKKKVGGEFALIYLCYNFRRVLTILGAKGLKNALNAAFCHFIALSKAFRSILKKMNQNYPKK